MKNKHENILMFLDSGAFSADSQNKPVELNEYIDFIFEHEKQIDIYPVLDVIGNAEATWKNQKTMEKSGLSPMPVFHVEDDIKYLHRCMDYCYFCLGGMAGGASAKSRQHFLNTSFDIICDSPDRKPINKVHGFGLAAPSLMVAYPFYSIDTSSWVSYSQFGIILLPKRNNKGEPEYGKTPIKIFVTERSPKMALEGQHFKNLSNLEQLEVTKYLSDMGFQMGTSITFDTDPSYELQESETFINKEKTRAEAVFTSGVCNTNTLRYNYNMKYFQNIADSCPEWPWAWSPTIRSFF